MGGQAFPDLHVPRMKPQVYDKVKRTAIQALLKRFGTCRPMPEAPGKTDFGDVDLVVELPLTLAFPVQQVAIDLQAIQVKSNEPVYSFAVPLDLTSEASQAFAQVDVQICPPGGLNWTLFLHGYGDLGSILGIFNYVYGFTSKNDGFFVRIKEQEAQNWYASQVFLSKDPELVMDFLGLDKQKYQQGFGSEQQLFEWASTSRVSNRRLVEKRKDNSEMRSRMEKRPMFRRFISEYLPSIPDPNVNVTETRETLTQAALDFFDQVDEFCGHRAKVLVENAEDHAWHIIKITVLTPLAFLETKRLNEVVRAFKRFVSFRDGEMYVRDEAEMNADSQARFTAIINAADEITPMHREWILANWKQVRDRERQRVKSSKMMASRTG